MKYLTAATIIAVLAFSILITANCNKPIDQSPRINCEGLVTDTLGKHDNAIIFMPNAFTPNNDGLDDYCQPYTKNVHSISFTVYDGANAVVFQTDKLNDGWHAPAVSERTTYYFKLQAITNGGNKIGLCGEVYGLACIPGHIPRDSLRFLNQATPSGYDSSKAGVVFPACP